MVSDNEIIFVWVDVLKRVLVKNWVLIYFRHLYFPRENACMTSELQSVLVHQTTEELAALDRSCLASGIPSPKSWQGARPPE